MQLYVPGFQAAWWCPLNSMNTNFIMPLSVRRAGYAAKVALICANGTNHGSQHFRACYCSVSFERVSSDLFH